MFFRLYVLTTYCDRSNKISLICNKILKMVTLTQYFGLPHHNYSLKNGYPSNIKTSLLLFQMAILFSQYCFRLIETVNFFNTNLNITPWVKKAFAQEFWQRLQFLYFKSPVRDKNYRMYIKITDNFNSNQTNCSKSTQRNIFNFTYQSFHTKLDNKITHVNDLSHNFGKNSSTSKMYNLSLIFRDFYFEFFY